MTFKVFILTSLAAISLAACSSANKTENIESVSPTSTDSGSTNKNPSDSRVEFRGDVSKFPYQSYLDMMGEDDFFPTIGEDGGGFNAISDKIRYLELSNNVRSSGFIDSLLAVYNMTLAYNTIAYDLGTAECFIDEPSFTNSGAHALENVNLSGIIDASVREVFSKMGKTAAQHLRKQQLQTDYGNPYVEQVYKCSDAYMNGLLNNREPAPRYDPISDLSDYVDLHKKALNDTSVSFVNNLIGRVLEEVDFKKKCILAYELAYSYYRADDPDYRDLVTIIDGILKSGEYSPLLYELWLIWRSTLQTRILSGVSNASAMYNLLYNDMRNTVAVTCLNHIASNPNDEIAIAQYIRLTITYNVVRNRYDDYNNALADLVKALPDLYKE